MDAIVSRYDATARARVAALRSTEAILFALMLGAIALDGLLVFRPAVAGLRRHLDERRRAEAAVLEVSDREQRRIGQDLHDGVAQLLAGVALMLKRVEKHAAEPAELASIRGLVDQAIGQTRTLAKGLYATELDREGLESALRELCASTEAIYRVRCAAEVSLGGAKIDPARGVHVYRVAREAVTNAVKHGHAKRIAISLGERGGVLVLEVTDDGEGFDPSAPSSGMGIHLMRYRASVVDGSLDVKSSPGAGTSVTCRVPLVDRAPS
jgi:signal transduction histidine kinase